MARQLLLNRGAQIEGEMKSIGNLLRVGCAAASAIGVQTLSVPADEFDPRVLGEPSS
jgi:hypothetical protein